MGKELYGLFRLKLRINQSASKLSVCRYASY